MGYYTDLTDKQSQVIRKGMSPLVRPEDTPVADADYN